MSVRVVIVEDEAIVALDLRRQLEDLGHVVCGVHAEAQAAIAASDVAPPDLAIMDIRLLGATDGLVAAEDLYVCAGVPVVLVSAYPDPATLARARRAGAYAFVPKPFSPAALGAAIELTLGKHAELRRALEAARVLRAAIEQTVAALVVTDAARRVALINPAAARLVGVHAAELLDRDLAMALAGLDAWASVATLGMQPASSALHGTARGATHRLTATVVRGDAEDGTALWTWTLALDVAAPVSARDA